MEPKDKKDTQTENYSIFWIILTAILPFLKKTPNNSLIIKDTFHKPETTQNMLLSHSDTTTQSNTLLDAQKIEDLVQIVKDNKDPIFNIHTGLSSKGQNSLDWGGELKSNFLQLFKHGADNATPKEAGLARQAMIAIGKALIDSDPAPESYEKFEKDYSDQNCIDRASSFFSASQLSDKAQFSMSNIDSIFNNFDQWYQEKTGGSEAQLNQTGTQAQDLNQSNEYDDPGNSMTPN